jgi:predicted lipoprotein with Yx(FWY)xxD motif
MLNRPVIAGVLITLLAATGIAIASQKPTLVNSGTVKYASTSGTALIDSRGHALYMSTHDGKDKSRCSGNCALNFKALTTAAHSKAEGKVNQKLLGRIKHGKGRYQVTYNHHPLYTATTDQTAGVALQEGCKEFKGTWYILNTKGNAIKPSGPHCQGY